MKEGLTLSKKEGRRTIVLNGVLDKRLTKERAAELLGVSERHIWRLLADYRAEGAEGLRHGNRGRPPAHTTAAAVREQLVKLATGPYDGANYAHIADLASERDGLQLSRWTVRRVLKAAGVGSPHHRRRHKHRSRRERYPQEGMLLQVDGSPHAWLEDRGPRLTLIGGIDDATGRVPYALFREQEDAQGYLLLLQGVAQREGLPLAVYSDRHSIFVPTAPETIEEQLAGRRELTQVGRALEELGIESILAHSPQAKGRVERLWQTFQDRGVTELRLAGARTLEEANRVLKLFLPKFNARFAVLPEVPGAVYRLPPGDLDGVLCMKYLRVVDKDNTVAFGGKSLQILATPHRASYARARVEVQERLDGRVVIRHQGLTLATTEAPAGAVLLRARKGPRAPAGFGAALGSQTSPAQAAARGPSIPGGTRGLGGGEGGLATEARRIPAAKSQPPKPRPDHPWRKGTLTNSLHRTTDRITAP